MTGDLRQASKLKSKYIAKSSALLTYDTQGINTQEKIGKAE